MKKLTILCLAMALLLNAASYASTDGAAPATSSGPTASPAITETGRIGSLVRFEVNTTEAMDLFYAEIKPIKDRTMKTLDNLISQEASIKENLIQRLAIITPGILPAKYAQLSVACADMIQQMRSNFAELEWCKTTLENKRVRESGNFLANTILLSGKGGVTSREQKLLDSGKKKHINRPGGKFVQISGTLVAAQTISSKKPVQDQYDDLLLRRKNKHLIKTIQDIFTNIKSGTVFLTWVTYQEETFSYLISKNSTEHCSERLDHLIECSKRLSQHPSATPENKTMWRELWRGHLTELVEQNKIPESPEAIKARKKNEGIAQALQLADEQSTLDEKRGEQIRIRKLRAEQGAAGNDDDDVHPVAAAAEPAQPKEMISLLKEDDLENLTRQKLRDAIEEIKHDRKPIDYRATLTDIKMTYQGKERLVHHCGLSGPMRLYYIFTKERLILLDISNHDMERLARICSAGYTS